MRIASLVRLSLAIAFTALCGRPAKAVPLIFSCVATGNAANCAVGEGQLLVDVLDNGDGEVAFVFSNDGPGASSIAAIYVADERRTLSGPAAIHSEVPNVIFEVGASPKNLPGGSSADPAFVAVPILAVQAISPQQERGVNPGEHVGLVYSLSAGRTFEDVIADLSIGNLRLGVHVVGFAARGRESFITQLLLTETLE
jgi:hypothetical protein